MSHVIGLDIGGANLKAAHTLGLASSLAFPLWKSPQLLPQELSRLIGRLPAAERLAFTMTGELCDCFANQSEGVRFILKSIEEVAAPAPVLVWTLEGRFVSIEEARDRPHLVAAANWLAQATLVARLVPERAGLLIDMGSTTTDVIPLWEGQPRPSALADPERLHEKELLYTGARRTPVCAVLGSEVAAEFFATMADVYLVLGELPEEPDNHESADGRPFTLPHAHARLARMLCADPETCPHAVSRALAERARSRQLAMLREAIEQVGAGLPQPPRVILTSGAGAFVLERLRPGLAVDVWQALADLWGRDASICACAWAVAQLAALC